MFGGTSIPPHSWQRSSGISFVIFWHQCGVKSNPGVNLGTSRLVASGLNWPNSTAIKWHIPRRLTIPAGAVFLTRIFCLGATSSMRSPASAPYNRALGIVIRTAHSVQASCGSGFRRMLRAPSMPERLN